MRDLVQNVVRQINGVLSPAACEAIYQLAQKVDYSDRSPSRITGRILDLYPGNGRSTVLLASAARSTVQIVAVDPHRSSVVGNAIQTKTGSLHNYFNNLRVFGINRSIVSIVADQKQISDLLSKRSADLIVIQVPQELGHDDALDLLASMLDFAKDAVRSGGKVLVNYHRGFTLADDKDWKVGIVDENTLILEHVKKSK